MKLILRIGGVLQPAVASTPDHDLWSLTYDCQDYEELLHSSGQQEAILARSTADTPAQLGGVVQPAIRMVEEIAAQLCTARSDRRAQCHSRSHSAYLRADPPLLLLPLTLITCNTYLLPCLLAC